MKAAPSLRWGRRTRRCQRRAHESAARPQCIAWFARFMDFFTRCAKHTDRRGAPRSKFHRLILSSKSLSKSGSGPTVAAQASGPGIVASHAPVAGPTSCSIPIAIAISVPIFRRLLRPNVTFQGTRHVVERTLKPIVGALSSLLQYDRNHIILVVESNPKHVSGVTNAPATQVSDGISSLHASKHFI